MNYNFSVRGVHLVGNMLPFPKNLCEFTRLALAYFVPGLYFGENAQQQHSKVFPMMEKYGFLLKESGYFHLQATKPDTVGSALVDSPVGLAAYILEKFSTHTNHGNVDKEDGGLTERFTLDELLTNLMIYWTSGNVASSARFYKENMNPILFATGG